jgi:hypothetical protein
MPRGGIEVVRLKKFDLDMEHFIRKKIGPQMSSA